MVGIVYDVTLNITVSMDYHNKFLFLIFCVLESGYFPGRCANVLYKGVTIGKIGVLHPTVLQAFEINNPCSVVEITIEPFV